jgi:hypothetical protein
MIDVGGVRIASSPLEKHRPVDGSFEHKRCGHAALPQVAHEGDSMSMRRVVDKPLATRSTAAQPHHRSGRAGFVDERQPRRVKHALLAHPAPACAGYVRTLPLRRVQSFFTADVAASKEPPFSCFSIFIGARQ